MRIGRVNPIDIFKPHFLQQQPGLVAAALIPQYGWRSVFVAGGLMPIVLGFVLIALPESIRFMAGKPRYAKEARRTIERLTGDANTPIDTFARLPSGRYTSTREPKRMKP